MTSQEHVERTAAALAMAEAIGDREILVEALRAHRIATRQHANCTWEEWERRRATEG